MNANDLLLIFAASFTVCVLATPFVTRLARWAGAMDKPDNNRKVHASTTPRMGGLALAAGLFAGMIASSLLQRNLGFEESSPNWAFRQLAIWVASVVILIVGVLDDTHELRPRIKLAGQSLAVLVLYFAGIRIDKITLLGMLVEFDFISYDARVFDSIVHLSPASFLVTWFWFIACMNIWNLIDGMDGLASGVGLLVSGTLTIIALHGANMGPAALSVALSGGLAGFLLYNWHPACIFLGDTGSLLIGLLVGVIGVEGSLKGPSTVSILFPILAMGLPISDTAMAIFRRWVRNLPLSAADRRHIHHLLIGLGLTPRQSAILLYCFSGFLCGVVLLGLAFNHEFLALTLGLSGCMAFMIVLMSRRDELSNLQSDFKDRMIRGRQDRKAAMICFSTIQKQELRRDRDGLWALFMEACSDLGVEFLGMDGLATPQRPRESQQASSDDDRPALEVRIPMESEDGDRHWWSFRIVENTGLESDIVLRYLSRLVRSTAEKIEDLSPRPSSVDDASDLPELGSSDVEPPHPLRSTPTLENAAKVV
jgi:UDP-GlcNAc:undecaprenyl-phosphate GlcNAc-1-phosphate transferase